ncbi:UNVERIFIED_CONTAM: ERAD-associated E3 ubiquitin-protein ligase component HRD3A [Sesamum radiatum]|uniref:ERAD-associated E3 ubiquitin-protein ligase component HRD3A n=1 Tax=Sesamum radiatum TaxID=300843 RepID=A0AAW2WP98_SESRA
MLQRGIHHLSCALLLLALLPLPSLARPFVLVFSQDDLSDPAAVPNHPSPAEDVADFDDFPESESKPDSVLDPGSWSPLFEPDLNFKNPNPSDDNEVIYYNGVRKMVEAASRGDFRVMEEAVAEIEAAAAVGQPHGQSVMGFLYSMGIGRERSEGKAFLHHYFAAQGGNMQSKMALAYTYYRQENNNNMNRGEELRKKNKRKREDKEKIWKRRGKMKGRRQRWSNMHDKAVKLYAELAEVAVNSFLISKDSPVIEPIRIHNGAEENKEALRKSRGEEDEDFQILEYQAQKGNAGAMYKIGIFYYFGLRGLRRDHGKALRWFSKAVEKGEARAMELLGEIYARGAGVERNYTKALEWLTLASRQELYSAYNGMGYLYAKEYFEKAADNEEPGGFYNLGVMYLKGLGVKRDLKIATNYFALAANAGQPKAFYQLAKMFHTGVGHKKNLPMATALYKLVAERGPWSSLSRWALEAYLKGDIGKSFLLYSRMAEIGYEVAQSNAAWILDKYGERSMCMGESGLCTDAERHQRVHALWWKASEQGNEHAALLIGDAYYYGRGTERDYDRAAEAYMHAKSQSNAQAMFNLGYMHEHGQGLPLDLHLAKRYYDQALAVDPAAKLPVSLALASLWIRRNYANSFLALILPVLISWMLNYLQGRFLFVMIMLAICSKTDIYWLKALMPYEQKKAFPNFPLSGTELLDVMTELTNIFLKQNFSFVVFAETTELGPHLKHFTLTDYGDPAVLMQGLTKAYSFNIDMIDSLPEVYPKVEAWVEDVIMEEGNATILTLFLCLLTFYLRERQRRHAVAGDMVPPQQPVEQAAPLVM